MTSQPKYSSKAIERLTNHPLEQIGPRSTPCQTSGHILYCKKSHQGCFKPKPDLWGNGMERWDRLQNGHESGKNDEKCHEGVDQEGAGRRSRLFKKGKEVAFPFWSALHVLGEGIDGCIGVYEYIGYVLLFGRERRVPRTKWASICSDATEFYAPRRHDGGRQRIKGLLWRRSAESSQRVTVVLEAVRHILCASIV